MNNGDLQHLPVLLTEAVSALAVKKNGIYLDGTFGRGGHARSVLAGLAEHGRLLALDKDPAAITVAKLLAEEDPRFIIEQGSFAELATPVKARLWQGKIDGILFDLGVSSPQLDVAERGFSFQQDGPLDMRMDPGVGISAAQWLATASSDDIAEVLKTLGEERYSKRIAQAIVATRQDKPITTTKQLASLVAKVSPSHDKNKHPATRTFQAIRIYINNELADLKAGLAQALDLLAVGGRLVVISFHSLEDRIVKRFLREQARGDDFPAGLPVTVDQLTPRLRLLGKAVKASQAELLSNPRSRSAILRVAEKLQ